MLNIAVIGAGHIAKTNAVALENTGRARIHGVYSRTISSAQSLADIFSGVVYARFDDLLADRMLDAVIICTPQDTHRRYFEDCCKAGLHVLVEKPMAMTASDCQSMIETAEQCGIHAAVCHTQRYRSVIKDTIDLVHSGVIGEVISIVDTIDLDFFGAERPRWHFDQSIVGHALLFTHGSHQMDRVVTIAGQSPEWVVGRLEMADEFRPQAQAHGLDSGYHLLGAIGKKTFVITAGGYCNPVVSSLLIRGTNGTLRSHLRVGEAENAGILHYNRSGGLIKHILTTDDQDSYLRQMNDLLDCLEGKSSFAPSLRHAKEVVAALEAGARSHEGGSIRIHLA